MLDALSPQWISPLLKVSREAIGKKEDYCYENFSCHGIDRRKKTKFNNYSKKYKYGDTDYSGDIEWTTEYFS